MRRRRTLAAIYAAGAAIALGTVADAQLKNDNTPDPASSVTPNQVSARTDPVVTEAARASDLEVSQPTRPSRTEAVTSSEVSNRADGRELAIAPVIGTDRCDGAEGVARAQCRNRLEARADQYNRPRSAPVTPEARLLLLTSPGGTVAREDTPGQLGSASGLNAPNGPTEQLAGALRERAEAQDSIPGNTPGVPAGSVTLPPNVPSVVVIPPK